MQLRSDFSGAPTVKQVGQVDAVTRANAVADPRQEELQRTLSGMLGKSISAPVLARLTDGHFIVQVAGMPMKMMLPPGTRVGADVPLTVLAAQPRATFQITAGDGQELHATTYTPNGAAAAALSQFGAQARAGALLNTAALAQAMQQGAAPDDPNAASGPVLSAAGRMISSVLVAAQNAPDAPRAITGSEPLITTQAPDPAQLATRLQQAIAQSGLFYESHLAEWADGTRSLSDLMREPQTTRAPGAPVTDPNTAQFINLQLSSQEQARVAWQGQLAQGQQMQWEIQRDAPRREQGGGDGDPDQPTWRSGMRFRLPLLGEISATVTMVGDQIQIALQAGSPDVGGTLRQHAGALSSAMEAAGTPLSSLTIGVAEEQQDE